MQQSIFKIHRLSQGGQLMVDDADAVHEVHSTPPKVAFGIPFPIQLCSIKYHFLFAANCREWRGFPIGLPCEMRGKRWTRMGLRRHAFCLL